MTAVRDKVFEEIKLIPDNKLATIYDFIHFFRIGLQVDEINPQKTLSFSGSWGDMPEGEFDDFVSDIFVRRKKAFELRENREKSID